MPDVTTKEEIDELVEEIKNMVIGLFFQQDLMI